MTPTKRRSCSPAPKKTWSPLTTRRWRRSRPTAPCLSHTGWSSSTTGTTCWATTSSTAGTPTRRITAAPTSTWCEGGGTLPSRRAAVTDVTVCRGPPHRRHAQVLLVLKNEKSRPHWWCDLSHAPSSKKKKKRKKSSCVVIFFFLSVNLVPLVWNDPGAVLLQQVDAGQVEWFAPYCLDRFHFSPSDIF